MTWANPGSFNLDCFNFARKYCAVASLGQIRIHLLIIDKAIVRESFISSHPSKPSLSEYTSHHMSVEGDTNLEIVQTEASLSRKRSCHEAELDVEDPTCDERSEETPSQKRYRLSHFNLVCKPRRRITSEERIAVYWSGYTRHYEQPRSNAALSDPEDPKIAYWKEHLPSSQPVTTEPPAENNVQRITIPPTIRNIVDPVTLCEIFAVTPVLAKPTITNLLNPVTALVTSIPTIMVEENHMPIHVSATTARYLPHRYPSSSATFRPMVYRSRKLGAENRTIIPGKSRAFSN